MCLASTVVTSSSLMQEVAGSIPFTVITTIFGLLKLNKFNGSFWENSITVTQRKELKNNGKLHNQCHRGLLISCFEREEICYNSRRAQFD